MIYSTTKSKLSFHRSALGRLAGWVPFLLVNAYTILALVYFGRDGLMDSVQSKVLPDHVYYKEITSEQALSTSLGVYIQKLVDPFGCVSVMNILLIFYALFISKKVDRAVGLVVSIFVSSPFIVTFVIGINKEVWLFVGAVKLLDYIYSRKPITALAAILLMMLSRWGMGVVGLGAVLIIRFKIKPAFVYFTNFLIYEFYRVEILQLFGRDKNEAEMNEFEGSVQMIFDFISDGNIIIRLFRPILNGLILITGIIANIRNFDIDSTIRGDAYAAFFLPILGLLNASAIIVFVVKLVQGVGIGAQRSLYGLSLGFMFLVVPTAQYRYFIVLELILFTWLVHKSGWRLQKKI